MRKRLASEDTAVYMFGPKAEAERACGQARELRKPLHQMQQEWRLHRLGAAEHALDHVVLNSSPAAIASAAWAARGAAGLCARSASVTLPGGERPGKQVRRRDRVLDGEVDADTSDGRHGVRGIADAKQPRPVPAREPVHAHGQQLQLVQACHLAGAAFEKRRAAFRDRPEKLHRALHGQDRASPWRLHSRTANNRRGRS